jgi:hypothetical protein
VALTGTSDYVTGGAATAGNAETQEAALAASSSQQSALDQEIAPEVATTVADLNSGNYAGAWSTALSTSPLFGTNYNSATTDPLLQALESSSGLQQLDPSKTWNAQSIGQFDTALGQNATYNGQSVTSSLDPTGGAESLGKNPYGEWGSGSALTGGSDAATNAATAGDNSAPDVERFAGAVPTTSFLSKYGADIAALVATVASAGAGSGALVAALAGSAASDVVNAAQGKLTATGAIEGLATAALGASVPGIGSALGSATGLGATAGTALAGAGIGAGTAALTGGNPLIGAVGGGVSGALQGSGVTKTLGNSVGSALGGGTLANSAGAGLVGGGIGAATGAGLGALTGANVGNSALLGGVSGALKGATSSATGNTALGSAAGALGTMAISPLLSGGSSAVNPVNSQATALGTQVTGGTSGNAVTNAGAGVAVDANGVPISNGSSSTSSGATSTGGLVAATGSVSSMLGGLLGPALTGAAGAYAAQNAAEAETNADTNAITTQQNTLANASNIFGAATSAGNNADTQLQQLEGGTSTPANYSNFYNSPGYTFAVQQGTQAINRQASATGQAYTPNTLDAVGQYVTGTASQNYNNYVGQLQATANTGEQANQGLSTANTAAGTNISTLQQAQGVAQAAGLTGVANSITPALSQLGTGVSSLLGAGPNASGVASTTANGLTSAFSGTSLANNQTAINDYNANNGPTSTDISNSTLSGTSAPVLPGTIDPGSPSWVDTGDDTDGG